MKSTKILALILLCAALICSCGIRRIDDGASTSSNKPNVPSDTQSGQTEAPPQTGAQTDAISQTEPQTAPSTDPQTESQTELQTEPPAPIAPAGDYEPLVFMYHLILEEPTSPYEGLFVRPSEFKAQLGILNSLGYRYAFADEYTEHSEYPTAIITLDDGYEDNYTEMFPLIKEMKAKATVFVITSMVGTPGYLTEAQIKEMAASGLVSFQSHTVSHLELGAQSAEFIAREMQQSIAYLEGLTGRPVRAMAYPAGVFSAASMDEVGKYVSFAYTTEPPSRATVDSPLAIPRVRINRGCSEGAFSDICAY